MRVVRGDQPRREVVGVRVHARDAAGSFLDSEAGVSEVRDADSSVQTAAAVPIRKSVRRCRTQWQSTDAMRRVDGTSSTRGKRSSMTRTDSEPQGHRPTLIGVVFSTSPLLRNKDLPADFMSTLVDLELISGVSDDDLDQALHWNLRMLTSMVSLSATVSPRGEPTSPEVYHQDARLIHAIYTQGEPAGSPEGFESLRKSAFCYRNRWTISARSTVDIGACPGAGLRLQFTSPARSK